MHQRTILDVMGLYFCKQLSNKYISVGNNLIFIYYLFLTNLSITDHTNIILQYAFLFLHLRHINT